MCMIKTFRGFDLKKFRRTNFFGKLVLVCFNLTNSDLIEFIDINDSKLLDRCISYVEDSASPIEWDKSILHLKKSYERALITEIDALYDFCLFYKKWTMVIETSLFIIALLMLSIVGLSIEHWSR